MSLVYDEYGRPFIIMREQSAKSRMKGLEAQKANILAARTISQVLRTSLGPTGMDKMLVNPDGEVTITNDGATILKQLDVEHPAGKVLVELSDLQDQEVGDGTTSVVIIAAELLKRANELVKNKIHPTSIIAGYRLAMKEAIKYIKGNLTIKTDSLDSDSLISAAKTSMSSKIIGAESNFFAEMVVNAVQSVKVTRDDGTTRYPVRSINILKVRGSGGVKRGCQRG